ncbi:MAG: type II toxin-antitoxin system PemK/MazF family toxin [Microbacterium sp.]
MSSSNGILSALAVILRSALGRSARVPPAGTPRPRLVPQAGSASHGGRRDGDEPGRMAGTETIRVDPERITGLTVSYAPQRDGDPDAGEVIWTWVPYEENDGRGKDRPVLVIGAQSGDRVYAVRMTSKPHDGSRDYLPIGSGAWDGQGRESWVDIEQLYSVHREGMRREAAVLDRARYAKVASALIARYHWAHEG